VIHRIRGGEVVDAQVVEGEVGGGEVRGAPGLDDATVGVGPAGAPSGPPDVHLAGASPTAWDPHAPTVPAPASPPSEVDPTWVDGDVPTTATYPWEPDPEPRPLGSDYLDDLDPTVHEPYPWADGPRRPPTG
jgi:hypothetical protein